LVIRKMGHLTEYAILTLLAVRAIQFGEPRLKPRAAIGAFFISVLYACSDEFHQRFVPGRTSSPRDIIIDSVGVTLVMLGILLWFVHKSVNRGLWKRKPSHATYPRTRHYLSRSWHRSHRNPRRQTPADRSLDDRQSRLPGRMEVSGTPGQTRPHPPDPYP